MKKLLLAFCLTVICANSIHAEETQQANWKENVAKYGKIAGKVGFVGLCMHQLGKESKFRNYIETVLSESNYKPQLELPFLAHLGRSSCITFIAFLATAKSLYEDFKK